MTQHKILAVTLHGRSHPSLMELFKNGNLHYLGLSQNVGPYDPRHHTVVREYGEIEHDDYDAMDRLEILFSHDYPPETGIQDSPGWLAPDGVFYPCQSWEHDSVADYIYRYVYSKTPKSSAVREFEQLGWVRIHQDVFANRKDLSQEQLDSLWDIHEMTTSEQLKKLIDWIFEDQEPHNGNTFPNQKGMTDD